MTKTPDYQPRYYRDWSKDRDLVSFNVMVKETDLYIRARRFLKDKALEIVQRQRSLLENYIARHPGFVAALEPFPVGDDAPAIARTMADAAEKVNVGPMAAVAGAFAEFVGRDLLKYSAEVIVENGGDIFLKSTKSRLVGVYAGEDSPLTGRIAIENRTFGYSPGCLYFFGHGGPFAQFRQVRCGRCPFSFCGLG